MQQIDPETAIEYLKTLKFDVRGAIPRKLAGGVSNTVIRVDRLQPPNLVVKQACRRLRTEIEWISQLERNTREAEIQDYLSKLGLAIRIPRVLSVDPDHHAFVMEAVESSHRVWKQVLLNGEFHSHIFQKAARCLAGIHRRSALNPPRHPSWFDRTVFDELRIDPFYRWISRESAASSTALDPLIEVLESTGLCVVLADFSPKNILITTSELVAVDFETAHFGDPAFDLGFFLSHLVLKWVKLRSRRSELLPRIEQAWDHYHLELEGCQQRFHLAAMPFEERCVQHLGACILSRIDGKSPVDYLGEHGTALASRLALAILSESEMKWSTVIGMFRDLANT